MIQAFHEAFPPCFWEFNWMRMVFALPLVAIGVLVMYLKDKYSK